MSSAQLNDLVFSILEGSIYLLAAELFLSENIKKLWPKIVLFSILNGSSTVLSYHLLFLKDIRQLLNITTGLFLIKLIFKTTWWRSIKINVIFTFFGIISQTIMLLIVKFFYNLPLNQLFLNSSMLLKINLPLDLSTILMSLGLRRINKPITNLIASIKTYRNGSIIISVTVAILFQAALLISSFGDYIDNIASSENPLRVSFIAAINLLIIFFSLYILFETVRNTEEKIVAASSEVLSKNLTSLLNSVKCQRHDFINHLQIINSLFHVQDKEGLSSYLHQLTNEITVLNNVLKVDNPFIGALLNTKITKAGLKGINLQVDITAKLTNLSAKAFDLTRIMDNLINNAIEELERSAIDEKWIKVSIKEQGPFLSLTVTNPGSPPAEIAEKLFEPGYTTKDGEHCGLGLHICKQLSKKLHGKLEFKSVPGIETCFSLIIPKS